jgi:hypothetical protein
MSIWNQITNLLFGLSILTIIVVVILKISFWLSEKLNKND